jgi:Right handed beta helix region
MKTNTVALLTLVSIAGALLQGQARAASLTVCPTGCQYSTIQSAINQANDNDVINIQKGHYFENLNTQGKALTLWGIDNRQAIVDGNGNGTVITIPGTNPVTVRDLTIMRGFGNGGGIAALQGAALNVRHTILVNNYSTSVGGGGINYGGSAITIFDCTVTNNTAMYGVGGVQIVILGGGSAVVESSTIARNSGGGISFGGEMFATVDASSIVDNTGGGGLSTVGAQLPLELAISNSTIAGNSAESFGGGIFLFSTNAVLNNVFLTRNTTGGNGGGIYMSVQTHADNSPSTISLTATYVVGNSAGGDGGGTYLLGTIINGGGNVIQGNTPDNCGKGTNCP